MPSEAVTTGRRTGGQVGPYGRQPVYWALRERGITQTALGPVVARSTSYLGGVLHGWWAPGAEFVSAVGAFLRVPVTELFTEEMLKATRHQGEPRIASLGQARRARTGRFGRQPAYWVLRERRIPQGDLMPLGGRSTSHVSQVLNGSTVPDLSFVESVSKVLDLAPSDLFTADLLDASRRRVPGLVGPPPSRRVGPYGRQPAYWMLRNQGIRQNDLGVILGRSDGGHVSKVLNGFLLPDVRFVVATSDLLGLPPAELFRDQVLKEQRSPT